MILTRLTYVFVAIVVILGIFALMAAWSRQPRPAPGLRDGSLLPCPKSPNCVSSEANSGRHIDALAMPDGDAMAVLREAVARLPRTEITSNTATYLHAECRTEVFGFVDDLGLRIDAAAGVVHVRSASRVGYSDRGANRRRVEDLRILVAEVQP